MSALLNQQIQSLLESGQRFDVLLFAGCGHVSDVASWAGLARRVVLVDADEKACKANTLVAKPFQHVEVVHAVVSVDGGEHVFYRHNFSRFDGLSKPAGIAQRYPNIAQTSAEREPTVSLQGLLSDIAGSRRIAIVLDLNGAETEIAASLSGPLGDAVSVLAMTLTMSGLFAASSENGAGLSVREWAQQQHWMPVFQQAQASQLGTDCVFVPNTVARDLNRAFQALQDQVAVQLKNASDEVVRLRSDLENASSGSSEEVLALRSESDRLKQRHAAELSSLQQEMETLRQVSASEREAVHRRTSEDAQRLSKLQTALDQQTLVLQERAQSIEKLNAELAQLKGKRQVDEAEGKQLQSQIEQQQAELQELRVRNEALEAGSYRLGQQVLKSEGQLQLIKEMLLGDLQPRIGRDET